MIERMQEKLKSLEALYEKHERRISSFALLFGFIFDSLTLKRIDLLYENLVILSYILLAGGGIMLINFFEEKPPVNVFLSKVQNYLPLLIQFSFGGLFSAFFIFYSRSAAFSSSWPFLLALIFLLVGNEFFKKYYQQLVFHTSVYFVAVFSFAIFYLPILTKTLGVWTFLLSAALSAGFIAGFVWALLKISPIRYSQGRANMRNSLASIFLIINLLYFTNLIPPIPLSLKDGGIYRFVEPVAEGYRVVGERGEWYDELLFFMTERVHWQPGQPLYAFSAVFAPTDLDTEIIHNWQYYDEAEGEWVSASRISFAIFGGRDGGYRGYSTKSSLFEGKWRVDVETPRGQVIGRMRFDVVEGAAGQMIQKVL